MSRLLLLATLWTSVLPAATFTVDTTSDTSLGACTAAAADCSFSGAIAAANATGAQDTIAFAIPMSDPGCDAGSGVCTITPVPGSSRFVSQPLIIDGYTQPGAVPNSNTPAQGGLNGALKIQLDGNNGGNAGLNLASSTPSVVRGLIINRFNSRAAIELQSTAAHRIEGNYIGTDPSGTLARPNNEFGILVNGQGGAYVIGGLTPDTRNLISGNQVDGVHFQTGFQGGPSDGMRIQGNLIGTTASGLAPMVNGTVAVGGRSIVLVTGSGGAQNILVGGSDPNARNVLVGVSSDTAMYIEQYTPTGPGFLGSRIEGNLLGQAVAGTAILGNSRVFVRSEVRGLTIGGTTPGSGNVIAGGSLGIDLAGQARVLGNSIRAHTGLGISLSSGTRVPNDANDTDTRRQNFPEISDFSVSGSNLSISYRVDSTAANSVYPLWVEFFKADGDEGSEFIGADDYLSAEAQSVKSIVLPIPPEISLNADDVIVATATDAQGNSSEFSFAGVSLAITDNPDPAAAGTPFTVDVEALALDGPNKPNGIVDVSMDSTPPASCSINLTPRAPARTSGGSCSLTAPQAGSRTITATFRTASGAFGSASGSDVVATTSHTAIQSFTVDTTAESSSLSACTAAPADCSFNGAVSRANSTGGANLVAFDIPTSEPGCAPATGVCRIQFTSAPTAILDAVTIDGYTQPGAVANTLTPDQGGSNAQIKIELRGCPSCANGVLLGAKSTVRGLAVGGFVATSGISFDSNSSNGSVVEGNFIGTDASGLVAVSNANGVSANGNPFAGAQPQNVRIGGSLPAQRNLISGNSNNGIEGNGTGMQIVGNLIGTDATGLVALPNQQVGVFIAGCGNFSGANARIGGLTVAERNIISGNGSYGVQIGLPNGGCGSTVGALIRGNYLGAAVNGVSAIGNGLLDPFPRANVLLRTDGSAGAPNIVGGREAGAGNLIAGAIGTGVELPSGAFAAVFGNRMRDNRKLGIDGGSGGRDLNDAGDADNFFGGGFTGRNQNFPVISAFAVSAGNAQISYTVDSAVANSVYPLQVDFYLAAGDEGGEYLGSDTYSAAEAQTLKSISLPVPSGLNLSADDVIVATATDADHNNSEFSFTQIQSLTILSDSPDPSPAGIGYLVSVRAESVGTPFKPNGSVQISDGRGGTCAATLAPTAIANRSEGSCELISTGAPGTLTLTASYSTFGSAFATADGGSIAVATASHELIPGVTMLEALSGNNQYASVGGAYVEALRVRVLGDGGAPFPGAAVQFMAPVAGASAGLSATSAVSDADGFAQVLATANAVAGRYAVSARVGALTQTFMLNNDSSLGSRCTGARSSTLGFRDDFVGSAIDPARWSVDANGGAVGVAGGEASVSAGNVVGFPYVSASPGSLPASGAFSLRWVATYTSTAESYGNNSLVATTGLAPDGGPAGNLIFHAYAGQYPSGYVADARISAGDTGPAAFISNPPALVRREVEYCWLAGRNELWVDGVRIENPLREATLPRPDALWFGNFDRGLLPAEHPDFRLDLVEVRQLDVGFETDLQITANTPNPSVPGQSVLVSVALNPESGAPGAPTGSVPVRASTGESCTISLPASSCSLNFATVGERVIEASYAGDELFRTSKSAQRSHRVQDPPSLRIGDVAIAEGDSGKTDLSFSVTLDNPTGAAVSVNYATAPDSATSPADFAATSGSLSFSGSTATQTFVVQLVGDTTVEPTERFFVNLSAANGASVADAQAIGTITNDDAAPPPVISIANAAQVSEPANGVIGRFARFVVSLDRPVTAPVSATLDLQPASAQAGLDFADQQSTEIVFEPGGPLALNVDVAILEDAIDEANESFSALLSAPSGVTLGNAQGEAVIIDGANATLQVNSSADGDDGLCSPSPGGCTLREAIIAANSAGGRALISFAIPGSGVQTIRPLSPLPTVTARNVEINGYTQAGATPNTVRYFSDSALDSVITVELDGGLAGASNGLKLCGAATVRGLAIGGFPQAAIVAGCDGNYNPPIRIYGNFIGTAADGITPRANGRGVIAFPRSDGGAPVITDAELDIGGFLPAQRNLVAASTQAEPAIQVFAFSLSLALRIQGNLIGTDRSGVRVLGNAGAGIEVRHPRRSCLVAASVDGNVIAGNRGDGLRIVNGNLASVPASCASAVAVYNVHVANRIGVGVDGLTALTNSGAAVRVIDISAPFRTGNTGFYVTSNTLQVAGGAAVVVEGTFSRVQISSNQYIGATLPIDLGANGATPNDPGDSDSGPNNLLNAPVVATAGVDLVAREVDISYTLDTPIAAERKLIVDVYAEDDSGIARFVGSGPVTAASGVVSLRLSDRLDAGDRVRLGLSAQDDGSSELSANAVTVTAALPQVSANRRRENAGQALVFTVSLNGAPAQPVTLNYSTADGSANAGSDYTSSSGSISLSAATPSATVNVPVLNDSLLENPETVLLNVSPSAAGSGIGSARGEAVIEDDDVLVRDEGQYDTVFLPDLDGRNGLRIVLQPSNWLRLAGRGDFSGDGAPDLAIASTQLYSPSSGIGVGPGAVYLLTSLVPPFAPQVVVPPAGAAGMARLDGAANDAAGSMLDMVDLRGDGLLDVLTAVPGRGVTAPVQGGNRVAGGVSIVNGRASPLAATGALASTAGVDTIAGVAGFGSAAPYSRAGYTVSAIGDVNGDGRQDLAVSSPAVGGAYQGEVHLVFGRATTTALPANLSANTGGVVLLGAANALLGLDVRGVGDFDNDGIDDLAIVSRTKVYLVRGRANFNGGGNIDSLPAVVRMDGLVVNNSSLEAVGGGRFHAVLSRGGDVDADGFDDFVVMQDAVASTSGGRARGYLVYGSAIASGVYTLPAVGSRQATQLLSEWARDSVAPSADILPDFNGDGRADVVLGAAGADEYGVRAGTVYVIYGRSGLPAVIDLFDRSAGLVRRIEGPALARAGAEVRAVADFQGDGLGDLAISAPGSGSVYLLFSNNRVFNGSLEARAPSRSAVPRFDLGRATPAQRIDLHAPADTAAGRLITSVGDINGDGRIDVLRDANPYSFTTTPPRSQYTIAFGAANGPLPADSALNGRNGFSLVGASTGNYALDVSGGGDVDGDGRQDLAVTLSDGSASLVYGRTTLTRGFPASLDTAQAAAGLTRFGFSDNLRQIKALRVVGDVNGDGRNDLLALSCGGVNGCAADSSGWRADLIYGRASRAAFTVDSLATPGARVVIAAADGRKFDLYGDVDVGDIGGDTRADIAIRMANGEDAIVFGSSSLPASIDPGALTGTNGFRIVGAPRTLNRLGRFTGGSRDDLAIILSDLGVPGSAGAVQVYRGRAGSVAASINPLVLGPATLGPRFLGTPEIPLAIETSAFRTGRVAVAAHLSGDSALEMLIASEAAEGRAPRGGVAVIVPGLGSAWTNSNFTLDYSDALATRIVTGEGFYFSDSVWGLESLGDWDSDSKAEIAVNRDIILRGSALQ